MYAGVRTGVGPRLQLHAPPKSKLAADHLGSLAHIHVDTDENGVVWLSGSAHNQEAVDQAMSIARDTEGVKDVKSAVRIRHDD